MSHQQMAHVRILLAEDHPMLRRSLRALLEAEPDFQVIAETDDGCDALALTLCTLPDVLLTDLNIPGMNGIELTQAIRQQAPHVAVVGLSMNDDRYFAQRMHDAGAYALLNKAGDIHELLHTLRSAADGAFTAHERQADLRHAEAMSASL